LGTYIMYYRRLYLSFVVSLLLLNPFIFTGCNNNVDAQNDVTVIAPDIQFLPSVGFPFSSRKDDGSGEFETGSFIIDKFIVIDGDGSLAASGLLKGASLNPSGAEVTLPVAITAATCHFLQMEIGPPDGLLDPIIVVAHDPLNKLTRSEHCQISQANTSGDGDSLVGLLNQEGTAAAPFCPWYTLLACAAPLLACAVPCVDCLIDPDNCFRSPESIATKLCIVCLAVQNAAFCLPCLEPTK